MSTNDPIDPQYSTQPPAAAPVPPVAPAAPAAPYPAAVAARSKTLGLVAFGASVLAVVVGAILAYLAGQTLGGLVEYTGTSGQVTTLPPEAEPAAASGGILSVVAFLVFGLLALWGFIQGIVAIVKKAGRGWGIAALIIAVVGGGLVATIWGIGFAAGAAPFITTVN